MKLPRLSLWTLALAACLSISAEEMLRDSYRLGLLDADGIPGKASIEVIAVDPEGLSGQAGLQAGDLILGVNDLTLSMKKPCYKELMEALDAASAKKAPVCILGVERKGKPLKLKLALPALGPHAASCPKGCARCEAALQTSLAWLVTQQEADGAFPTKLGGKTGKVVVTSLCGMAFLAHEKCPDALARAAEYVSKNACGCGDDIHKEGANWNQSNWALGYAGAFLGLMDKAQGHKDPQLKGTLQAIAEQILKNQEASGGWAHGPGGPNALNYLELEIVGNWCLAALGLARQAGVTVNDEAINKAWRWIEDGSPGGGVAYSNRPGQKGSGEAGRTGGAIFAWQCLEKHTPSKKPLPKEHVAFFKQMLQYWQSNIPNIVNGHVSPALHLCASALAAQAMGGEAWTKFMARYQFEILALRKRDGSFAAHFSPEFEKLKKNSDQDVGACWNTGTYLMILGLPNNHLNP